MFLSVPIVLGVLTLVLLGEIAFHLYFGNKAKAYFEDGPPFQSPQRDPAPDAVPIEFTNGAGQTLRGAILPRPGGSPRGLLIFCPEMQANFWSFQAYVPAANLAGFDILAFDFRSQGLSDAEPGYEPLHWLTEKEIADVDAAVSFARSRPEYRDLPIVLHGVSRGAGAALAVTARRPDIAGVTTQGAFTCWSLLTHYMRKWRRTVAPIASSVVPDWHNRLTMAFTKGLSELGRGVRYSNIEPDLRRLSGKPLLWMAGQRDTCVPPEVATELFALTGHSPDDFWMVPKAKHNGERVAQRGEFDRRLVKFLCGFTGRPPIPVVTEAKCVAVGGQSEEYRQSVA